VQPTTTRVDDNGRYVRYTIAGLVASLVGVGIARLAYTPLIPHLVEEHWFASSEVITLGSLNLIGYLFGAIFGRRIGQRTSNVMALIAMEILVTISFVACAFPLSVIWFGIWRFASGFGGGVIMVLAAATILPCLPKELKSPATAAIFLGLGLGIVIAAVLVPLLVEVSLRVAWLGLSLLCAVLTILTWRWWPSKQAYTFSAIAPLSDAERAERSVGQTSTTIYIVYGLMAIGVVPLMVFLSDFAVRELHVTAAIAATLFIVYGIGATCGPPIYAALADRIKPHNAVRVMLAIQTFATLLVSLTGNLPVLVISAFIAGTFPPAGVSLTLAWLYEVFPDDPARESAFFSRATIVFAATQAIAAFLFSSAAARGVVYSSLIMVAAGALFVGLVVTTFAPSFFTRHRCAD
jgi:predicted MFS family arabinose efflux permease